jgi:hypothetical protein
MQTIQTSYSPSYLTGVKKQSLVSRFFSWCESQEPYRYGWLAAIITIHGCVLAPLTLFTIFLGGNNIVFWGLAIGAFAMPLVSNLAAMPTKITIPVFFLSVLIDVVVIALNIAYFVQG